ncbi:glycosyltransferase [Agarivorans litoreus]|uniref:glycosyltransferase n=1 Tax=Agarivorans litoreus TaxID=1510455 RepID=UPI001C7CC8A2|nr:glycosyltransferase [Agarivorans litoreus]
MYSAQSKPVVSVVMVTYNCVETIEKTVTSICKAKEYSPGFFEFIVIDGLSSDGTVSKLEKYSSQIDILISEKDKGIYNAMNKGILNSQGAWVLFLNDGDLLIEPAGLTRLFSGRDLSQYDCVVSTVHLSNGQLFKPMIGFKLKIANTMHHQGLFYKRTESLFFNEGYKVFSDFDLNQKYVKQGKRFLLLDNVFTYHSLNGVSNRNGVETEFFNIVKKNQGMMIFFISYFYFKIRGLRCRVRKLFS